MINEIIYAVIQAATEYLPVSSSGHLAIASNILAKPDVALFTLLHLASALAVMIFMGQGLVKLATLDKEYRKLWIYIIVATAPAVLFGLLFRDIIEAKFSNMLFLGVSFIFTAMVLFMTKFASNSRPMSIRKAFIIGLCQCLALFPGISRSGMTISTALLLGVDKIEAAKFSFIISIPLCLGAFILELPHVKFTTPNLVAFGVCFVASLGFIKLLLLVVQAKRFWLFSLYCLAMGLFTIAAHFAK